MLIDNSRGSEWRKFDLHMHSTASDGKGTPEDLVNEAIKKGISVIALTDHHTADNIDRIKAYGKKRGITVISGIEFRTEYGQKSVHMIGLFPDYHNVVTLDKKALYELILSKLGLTRTEIMVAGRKEHPEYEDELAYKEGLLRVQVDFKKAADLIHQYGGIVSVHAGAKANSFDEEMKHEGKSVKNVGISDSLGPVKEELLNSYIDICEVRNSKESEFYLKGWGKPCIAASDAHTVQEVARNYCWIKGEATFEGLKQIIYEPESRVRIQSNVPEDKADYLVIDRIEIDQTDFGKQIIPFNKGLNTIIGGRSSGKSILLGCLARLCGNTQTIKENKPKYDDYIKSVCSHMKLFWRDLGEETERKIDYFPQGRIIDTASNPEKIRKLVEDIMRDKDGKNKELATLKGKLEAATVLIHQLFSDYRKKTEEMMLLQEDLQSVGNKEGINQEVQKLKTAILEIKHAMKEGLSDEENEEYERQKLQIAILKQSCQNRKNSMEELRSLINISFFVNIDFSTRFILDEGVKAKAFQIYEDLVRETQQKWKSQIESLYNECENQNQDDEKKISELQVDSTYVKARIVYQENTRLVEESQKLDKEKNKLSKIECLSERIATLKQEAAYILNKILQNYGDFYSVQKEFCDQHVMQKGDVIIIPKVVFQAEKFQQNISRYFDARNGKNSMILNYRYTDKESFLIFMKESLEKTLQNEFVLKNGNTEKTVAENIFSTNPFEIEYNINYQGDNLADMSEGKTAFVILKLLLDFSTNEYPIFIDQPEDDLDNRAISKELVKYLREKKKQRQIILVTHNPNVVVGADAEEIIVANQDGIGNKNPSGVKFAYRSGALEDSFVRDSEEILLKQGIRQHVCDVLEGGDKAFRLREQKYQLDSL